jgi:hypothetical protein
MSTSAPKSITSISELVLQHSFLDTERDDDTSGEESDSELAPAKQSHRRNTASLDSGLLLRANRSSKPLSSRIAPISELLENSYTNNEESDSEVVPAKQSHRQNILDFNSLRIRIGAPMFELDTAVFENSGTISTDEDDDEEGASSVPMSTRLIMPIVQYTSAPAPKSRERPNPGSSTTKQPLRSKSTTNPGSSTTKQPRRSKSTTVRPARLEAKTSSSTASENSDKSPLGSHSLH